MEADLEEESRLDLNLAKERMNSQESRLDLGIQGDVEGLQWRKLSNTKFYKIQRKREWGLQPRLSKRKTLPFP